MTNKHIKELKNIFENMKTFDWNETEHTILLGDFNNPGSKEDILINALTMIGLNPEYLKEVCCEGKYTQHAVYMDCEDKLHTFAAKKCDQLMSNTSSLCNHSYDSIMHYGNKNIIIKNWEIIQQDPDNPSSDHDMIRSDMILQY